MCVWQAGGSITSRKHYEGALQHLVSFLSVLVAFFTIGLVLLAESKVAKCSGEGKVGQLRQVPVLLRGKHTKVDGGDRHWLENGDKLVLVLHGGSHLPVLIQLEEGLVLSGAQHQEVDEQEHAKRIRVWIQTDKKQQTWMADYYFLKLQSLGS